MKSVQVKAPNQLEIIEQEMPTMKTDDVLVKIIYGGICGSDGHIYRGHNPFAEYPRIIGHEFFGVIERVGENVSRARLGERVAVDPVLSCGKCYACLIERSNVCETLQVMGVHTDGGLTEYISVPSQNAYIISDEISDEDAVTIEPFSIAANVTAHLSPTDEDVALVYGAGPIGLTCIQVLKCVYKVKTVISVDLIDERLVKAVQNGADLVINSKKISLVDYLKAENIKPTVIIDAACHPAILQEAALIASPAGRISIMGFSSTPSEITQQSMTSKELVIFSSRLSSKRFPEVIQWMEQRVIDPSKIVTHIFNFLDAQLAIEKFEFDAKSCSKILLRF